MRRQRTKKSKLAHREAAHFWLILVLQFDIIESPVDYVQHARKAKKRNSKNQIRAIDLYAHKRANIKLRDETRSYILLTVVEAYYPCFVFIFSIQNTRAQYSGINEACRVPVYWRLFPFDSG